jgi:hypothetical protein
MNKTVRQSHRGTLKIVTGVNTKLTLPLFFSVGQIKSGDLLRLANREYADDYERLLVVLCIAKREGIKKIRDNLYRFRGVDICIPRTQFVAKNEASNVLNDLLLLFTDKEKEEVEKPY